MLLKYFYFLDYGHPSRSRPRKRIPVDADNVTNDNDSKDDKIILDYSRVDFHDNDAQNDNRHNVKLAEEKAVWSDPGMFS